MLSLIESFFLQPFLEIYLTKVNLLSEFYPLTLN